jgi:hypothetical protein
MTISKLLICGSAAVASFFPGCSDEAELAPQPPIEYQVVRPDEMIVTEQWLDEGHTFDIDPPTILSYWPDFSKDDGTVAAAIHRCERSGGEMIAEFLNQTWNYKCEHIDY